MQMSSLICIMAAFILFFKPNVYHDPLLAASIQKKIQIILLKHFQLKNKLLIKGQGNEMISYLIENCSPMKNVSFYNASIKRLVGPGQHLQIRRKRQNIKDDICSLFYLLFILYQQCSCIRG